MDEGTDEASPSAPPVEEYLRESKRDPPIALVDDLVRSAPPELRKLADQLGSHQEFAEHALAMMMFLGRNLHLARDNQKLARWDRDLAYTMRDLRGKTLAIVGHSHTYARTGSREVTIGNGGAPLTSPSANYGFGLVQQRTDGAIQVDAVDYATMKRDPSFVFAVNPDGSVAP